MRAPDPRLLEVTDRQRVPAWPRYRLGACRRAPAAAGRAQGRYCSLCGAPLEAASPTPLVPGRSSRFCSRTFAVLPLLVSGSIRVVARGDWPLVRGADRAIERHGGAVEKHMGDGVMAVFGVPVAHEDDVLRAARAASELGESLAELNHELKRRWSVELGVRTGLNTGEAVVGDDPREVGPHSATPSTRAATGGGCGTWPGAGRRTNGPTLRGAARLGRAKPLALKGKAVPVPRGH